MDEPNPKPDDCPPFERHPIDPAIKEWALAQFSEEEFLAGLKEIRETGGYQIQDVLAAFDEAIANDERAA